MERHLRITSVDRQARVFLLAGILVIYCVTVIAVILAIEHFQAPLFNDDADIFPNLLMLTVWFLFYVAPLLLALIFGLLFRPFWINFRNILFTILIVQLLYSFTICMWRWDYLKKFENFNRWRKNDKIKILNMNPKHYDLNEDGFLDEIVISPVFDFTKIRPSEYLLDARLVPVDSSEKWTGSMGAPLILDGGGTFIISERGKENKITKNFTIKPRMELSGDVHLFVEMDFRIKFILRRISTVDGKGKKILRFARWAPYLRTTGWEGIDSQIFANLISLDAVTAPDVYALRAPLLESSPRESDP